MLFFHGVQIFFSSVFLFKAIQLTYIDVNGELVTMSTKHIVILCSVRIIIIMQLQQNHEQQQKRFSYMA